jgi:hypothetical protein
MKRNGLRDSSKAFLNISRAQHETPWFERFIKSFLKIPRAQHETPWFERFIKSFFKDIKSTT